MEELKTLVNRLSPLPETDFVNFQALFKEKQIGKKGFLQQEGNIVTELHYVPSGNYRGFINKDGEEITTHFYFGPTFLADYLSYKTKQRTKHNIQAFQEGTYYSANFDDLEALGETSFPIAKLFLKFFQAVYLYKEQRAVSFVNDSPEERYLNFFKIRPKVIEQMPLKYIASYLGMSPETLSRIRNKIRFPNERDNG
jgi:CRP-like cAMP-binding protein